MINKIFLMLFLSYCFPIFSIIYADIDVIVNIQTSIENLSIHDVKSVYLGKTRTFPNGQSAIPSINEEKTIKDAFLNTVLDKTSKQFDNYWCVRQFTGKGTSPPSLQDDEGVKKWLEANPNGIGFIDSDSLHKEDKKIRSVLKIKYKNSETSNESK
jgi:hypothetical protein